MDKGNILVIGDSGVGKSTLINAVLGEEKAETSFGNAGTTKELKVYENDILEFRVIDTVGFEPGFFKRLGAIPIPFSDAVLLSPLEVGEINAIAKIYRIENNKNSKRFLNSIVEAGTIGVAAKAAISSLKAIPGVNIAASVLNAIIAGSIVMAIGEVCVYTFEQIYLGKKTMDDIDWINKIIESKLSSQIMNKINTIAESEDFRKGNIGNIKKFFIKSDSTGV